MNLKSFEYYRNENGVLFNGDALEVLKAMPDESVQCCVTSPPYWGLRDYGVPGQLGLEKTPEEYIAKMVEIFREVRRVLRDDGTLWLNLGDSYAGNGLRGGGDPTIGKRNIGGEYVTKPCVPDGLKPKDLCGIPWRVAFALQADGWYLRSDIIWAKLNPMPESVTDRPTKSHEYLFLLSKNKRYFYDADAIREEPTCRPKEEKQYLERRSDKLENYGMMAKGSQGIYGSPSTHPSGRNKRTVWTVATHPFPEAHFATFPPKLIEPCILAGTSEKGRCPDCGKPWRRVVEKEHFNRTNDRLYGGTLGHNPSGTVPNSNTRGVPDPKTKTVGWQPGCSCGKDPTPCTVMDPFGGAGTTAVVAENFGRGWSLIELSKPYCDMIKNRIELLTRQRKLPWGG